MTKSFGCPDPRQHRQGKANHSEARGSEQIRFASRAVRGWVETLASNMAEFGQCWLKKTCTEVCYKSGKSLFFGGKVFRWGISDQLCHCVYIEPNLTAFPHQPSPLLLFCISTAAKRNGAVAPPLKRLSSCSTT